LISEELERILCLPDGIKSVCVNASSPQNSQRIVKRIEGLLGDDAVVALFLRPVGRVDSDRDLYLQKVQLAVEWAEPEPTTVSVMSALPSILIWFCTSVRTG
jgi:hypothetical protein